LESLNVILFGALLLLGLAVSLIDMPALGPHRVGGDPGKALSG